MATIKCSGCGFMTEGHLDVATECGACGLLYEPPPPIQLDGVIHESAAFYATMDPEQRVVVTLSGGREFAFDDDECLRLYVLFRNHIFFADLEAVAQARGLLTKVAAKL